MCQQQIQDSSTSEERREELKILISLCEDYVQKRRSLILELELEISNKTATINNGKIPNIKILDKTLILRLL